MSPKIHPTALVASSATLGVNVVIGAYAIVGERAFLGDDTVVHPHGVIVDDVRIGARCRVHSFAVIGGEAQDKKASLVGSLVIGDDNIFREHVTVHKGAVRNETHSSAQRNTRVGTAIGHRNLLMVGAHVGHDVVVGSDVTLSNGVLLAGHVTVEDHAVFGGLAAIQQFVRVGESAFVAGGAMVERDVIPYVIVQGDRARIRGVNRVGLARRGVDEREIAILEKAYVALFGGKRTVSQAMQELAESPSPYVQAWLRALKR